MLGKLFRYECKATGRILVPLYGAAILMGLISALFFNFFPHMELTLIRVTTVISVILFVCLIAASLGMSFLFSIFRFKKNLLGNEGYLMNTLPVSAWHNIGAKLLTAVIFQILSLVVAVISGMLFAVAASRMNLVELFLQAVELCRVVLNNMKPELWIFAGEVLAVALLAAVEMNVMIYAAMSMGHCASEHKVLKSIAAYIGFFIAAQFINSLLFMPIMKFGVDFNKIPHTGLLVVGAMELFYIVSYLLITNFFLKRKLNLQ